MEKKARKKRVGLIGAGAIGTLIADACEKGLVSCDELVIFDFDKAAANRLKKDTVFPAIVVDSFADLLKANPDVIVEAASQQAAVEYVPRIVETGIELIVMSTGALLQLRSLVNKVYFPSGAIGGLDAISAATLAGLGEVTLTTRKPPYALEMANTEPQLVYEGVAEEAAMRFPREMNVAATLALTV